MAASVVLAVDEFLLEGAEERLGCGVVPPHPGPAHRLADAIGPAELSGGRRGVLTRFRGRCGTPHPALGRHGFRIASAESGVAASSVRGQWLGRQELLDSSAEGRDTMSEGQDFDQCQRLPEISDRVHRCGGYPNRLRIRGITVELPEILRQYLHLDGGP